MTNTTTTETITFTITESGKAKIAQLVAENNARHIRNAKIALLEAHEATAMARYKLAKAEADALCNTGEITRSERDDILSGAAARYSQEIVYINEQITALA